MEYLSAFERLVELMTSLDSFDIPAIFSTLVDLCRILRISKGVTTFYASPAHEHRGEGEPFVCYDSGENHVLISSMRIVTPAEMIITCNVYQAEGAEPLTELERRRVETLQRMMLTYVNKSRQDEIIKRLMYFDAEGYNNLRYYYAQIMQQREQICNKTAARINLKSFSVVNEQLGKAAGDIVMRKYTEALHSAMCPGSTLCRLGGDNFVLLFDTVNLPKVEAVLQGFPVSFDDSNRVEVSAVAGVYSITDHIEHPGDIMQPIITAYLAAKRDNADDIVHYSNRLQKEKKHDQHIQRKFVSALKKEEFLVYYQPKVDIKTKKIVGAEALCRWMHKGKLVPPLDFIPALERGNDICRLDFYMLDHVCQDIRRWLDTGKKVVRVSVNLSRRHMLDPDLFEHIVEIVDSNKVPHELIEIELTETTTDVEFRDLNRVVHQLQEAGISTSVDDFGVGYSSLNLIKQIPWDVLKLDKSILPTQGEDVERGTKMFAHVISMAHEIGLTCVAEGVETEEHLDLMRRYGCRIAQGFLFDRPMPVDEFEAKMQIGSYDG